MPCIAHTDKDAYLIVDTDTDKVLAAGELPKKRDGPEVVWSRRAFTFGSCLLTLATAYSYIAKPLDNSLASLEYLATHESEIETLLKEQSSEIERYCSDLENKSQNIQEVQSCMEKVSDICNSILSLDKERFSPSLKNQVGTLQKKAEAYRSVIESLNPQKPAQNFYADILAELKYQSHQFEQQTKDSVHNAKSIMKIVGNIDYSRNHIREYLAASFLYSVSFGLLFQSVIQPWNKYILSPLIDKLTESSAKATSIARRDFLRKLVGEYNSTNNQSKS